ncbi:MAG: fumarylacetoacetate hydrolase family protein [Deltaproteobacteria bacterium]|nr:fumarylacetoacetate hydrolase family protein [Deltaproteobacteria bacterium]
MNIMEVTNSVWEAYQVGVYYPSEWKGRLSIEEAYQVQMAILDRHKRGGDVQAGWKICLNHMATKNQFHLTTPVFGFLLESNRYPSNISLSYDDLIQPGFDNELCLTFGQRLKGPNITPLQVRQAVLSVAPALEVVERRGDFSADLSLTIIDNVQQKAFITGREVTDLPQNLGLHQSEVDVFLNGELQETTNGTDHLADPAATVAWLVNRLSDFGLALEPGMRVMTGSITREFAPAPGDFYEAVFGHYGKVSAEIR